MFRIPPERMEDSGTKKAPEALFSTHAEGGEMVRPLVKIPLGQPLAG